MSDQYEHSLCDKCFSDVEPGRIPVRLVEDERERQMCCKCQTVHFSGIYFRAVATTRGGLVHTATRKWFLACGGELGRVHGLTMPDETLDDILQWARTPEWSVSNMEDLAAILKRDGYDVERPNDEIRGEHDFQAH